MAAAATAYAATLVKDCIMRHSKGDDGENLFQVTGVPKPDNKCEFVAKGWYDEVIHYNFSALYPFQENWPKKTGHFTQLVWKATTKLGCGYALKDMPMNIGTKTYTGGCKMVVCRYREHGNVAIDYYFIKNVIPNTTVVPGIFPGPTLLWPSK
ncbi:hypothetical protein Vretimale_15481 [Volvox reticuliferus]|uniref:SCP domain-containing protein n=1 Tax=Volvox reticuliferus TaxID=1737510 RepID=A0A8J4GRX9_9CHLO|nr:hypothetical protein Vretimale_15481 [Volvox reticuliferus]